jgi:hypothetical protein
MTRSGSSGASRKPPAKRAAARPRAPKFSEAKREQYLTELREGARRGAAAESVGISRETARVWMRDNAAFREQVEQAEMDANELVEDALFQAASSGNVTAIQVWLYNRTPERWRDMRAREAVADAAKAAGLVTNLVAGLRSELADEDTAA